MNASSDMNTLITEVKARIIDRIKSCYDQLTAEQWRLLSTCSPDATTKLLIADLILEMVTIVSKAFLTAALSNVDVSDKEVKTNLGKLVEDCLKNALNITDDVQCENSQRLRELVNIQVTLNITTENVSLHMPPPKILDAMLDSMVKMAARVKNNFTSRGQRTASPTTGTSDQDLVPVEELHASYDYLVREVPAETSDISLDSNDDTEEIQTSNKIIQDELNEMIGPLVDEMSESQLDSFQSDSCLEETLVESIVQELQEDTDPKRGKCKNLFTKQFIKMWLNRIWVQLTKKYQNNPTESPITLAEIPDLIVSNLTTEEKKQLNSRSLLLKPMPRAGALILTKRLTNFLFTRLMGKDILVSPRGTVSDSTGSVLQSDLDIYQEIWDKVWNFQGLMEWWENTQLDIITERLRQKLKKPEETDPEGILRKAIKCTRRFINRCVAQVKKSYHTEIAEFMSGYVLPEETPSDEIESPVVDNQDTDIVPEETPNLEEIKKSFFETIVEQLFTEVLLKNKVSITREDPNDMIRHLFETAWPEIKELDFEVTKKMTKILKKNLLKDLCKTLGGIDEVLFHLLRKNDDTLGQFLISSFERQVNPPERESSHVTKLFSSVGKSLVKIYEQRKQAHPQT